LNLDTEFCKFAQNYHLNLSQLNFLTVMIVYTSCPAWSGKVGEDSFSCWTVLGCRFFAVPWLQCEFFFFLNGLLLKWSFA
jgi:hypothetical protein